MPLFQSFRTRIDAKAGAADLRLFDALSATLPGLDPDVGFSSADKAAVLDRLFSVEGSDLGAEVIRRRVANLNAAAADGLDAPLFTIRSRKFVFIVEWSQEAMRHQERQQGRAAPRASAIADALPSRDAKVEPRFQKPRFRVFVSHGWDQGPNVEAIKYQFVSELRHSLDLLPQRYREKFVVDLFFDRHGGMHGRSTFDEQMDRELPRAAFGVMLLSPKWFSSPNCQKEWRYLADRQGASENRFLLVQATGRREDNDAEMAGTPLYPGHFDPAYANLLALWSSRNSATQDAFISHLRDQICEHLSQYGRPKSFDDGPLPPALRDLIVPGDEFAETRGKSIDSHFQIARAGQEVTTNAAEGDSGSVPALDHLFQWLEGEEQTRVLAILGGFGMGKTTTVQCFADALSRRGAGTSGSPVPVYLDFRRLLPRSRHGEPITDTLPDLIHRALDPVTAASIPAERIVDLIRSEPCVLILDGLDEIGNRIGADHAIAIYRQMLELVPPEAWVADRIRKAVDTSACPLRVIEVHGPWRPEHPARMLVIFDNVTDAQFLNIKALDVLESPDWLEIIVTTRLPPAEVGPTGATAPITALAVDHLPLSDAVELIRELMASGAARPPLDAQERQAVCDLARELRGFTLAVELAGAYLGAAPTVSVADYVEALGQSGVLAVDEAVTEGPRQHEVEARIRHRERQVALVLAESLKDLDPVARDGLGLAAQFGPE